MSILDGDIVRVTANFELDGGIQYQNVYHYIRDGTDPISDEDSVSAISARLQAAYASIASLVSDSVVVRLSFVDRIEFNEIVDEWRVVENIGTFTMPFTPIAAQETLPYQVSPYIVFKTQRPKSVGKKFLFPMTEQTQDSTILAPGAVEDIVDMAADLVSAILLGGDATLTPGIPRTGVQTFLNFLVAVVGDLLGSQRRRRPGVGA